MAADGCSGGVDWFYRRILRRDPPFGFCCDEHDLAYDEGGGWYDRWLADWRFARCLWECGEVRQGRGVLAVCQGLRMVAEVLELGRVNRRAL